MERAKSAAPRFSFCVLTLLIIYPLLVAGGTKTRKTMAHKVSKIIFGLLTLTFVASCSTEDSLVQETEAPAVKQQIITVGTPANGASTRVAYTDENVGTDLPALTWEEGDQLRIIWEETSNEGDDPLGGRKEVIYTLLPEDAGKTSGRFVGDVITAEGPFEVSVVYPDGEEPALKDNDLTYLKRKLTCSLRAENVTDLSNIQLSSVCNVYKLVFTNLPADLGNISFMKFAFKDENGGSVTYQSNVDISISEDKTSCTLYYVGNSTRESNIKTVEITLIGDRAYKVSKTFDTPRSYEALKRYTFTVDNTESTLVWQPTPTSECRYLGDNKVELVLLHPGGIKDALYSNFFSMTISPENVKEIVIKGEMKNEDLAQSDDFKDGITHSASILANWLRTKATSVTSVDMSQVSGLTEIPKMAFYGCSNSGNTDLGRSSLNKMVLPEGIITFGEEAFLFAYLTELNLPTTLTSIGTNAFCGTELTKLVFPQGFKTIGDNAMQWVYSNPSIIIPSSVISIGRGIVEGRSTIVFEGSTCDLLNDNTFGSSVNMITILLPEADYSKASTVRYNTTFSMPDPDPESGGSGYEVSPTIYYGWKNTEIPYENATVEDKLNTNNYNMLYN